MTDADRVERSSEPCSRVERTSGRFRSHVRPRIAMHTLAIRIRPATTLDHDRISDVHRRAFPDSENRLVAKLALDLLGAQGEPRAISLVAEGDGRVVGHIAHSPVTADDAPEWLGCILAPLAVLPGWRKAGIGSALVEHGIGRLPEGAVDRVFVYGDPAYYGRFVPPCELQHPAGWQARALRAHGATAGSLRLSCVEALQDPALW